jgi:hypothetical protein
MNINYIQSTGQVFLDDGTLLGIGFAGNDYRPKENPSKVQGKNNPTHEDAHSIGPIPRGLYTIGTWGSHPPLGPTSASLTPDPKNVMYGRSSFYIHGVGGDDPANCSEGCIVLAPNIREKLIELKATTVTVLANNLNEKYIQPQLKIK